MGRGFGVTPSSIFPSRGKCSVTLLNETDILGQYLEKEVSSVRPKMGLGGDCGGVPTLLRPLPTPLSPPPCAPSPQDCFFYSLVFDPVQKTLLADQGEIRVGCKYQAEIPERLAEGLGGSGGGSGGCRMGGSP